MRILYASQGYSIMEFCGQLTVRGNVCTKLAKNCPFHMDKHPVKRLLYPVRCYTVNTGHSTHGFCQKTTTHPSGICIWHRTRTRDDPRMYHPRKQSNPQRSLKKSN